MNGQLARVGAPSALRLEHSNRIVEVCTGIDGMADAERFPLDGLSSNDRFRNLLAANRIQSIHSLEPCLEDVFMKVTGEKLA